MHIILLHWVTMVGHLLLSITIITGFSVSLFFTRLLSSLGLDPTTRLLSTTRSIPSTSISSKVMVASNWPEISNVIYLSVALTLYHLIWISRIWNPHSIIVFISSGKLRLIILVIIVIQTAHLWDVELTVAILQLNAGLVSSGILSCVSAIVHGVLTIIPVVATHYIINNQSFKVLILNYNNTYISVT